jgi:hypothetical protein
VGTHAGQRLSDMTALVLEKSDDRRTGRQRLLQGTVS